MLYSPMVLFPEANYYEFLPLTPNHYPLCSSYTLQVFVLIRVQLFVTPWTVALQGPLSMRFSRQEYWNRLPCSNPEDLPHPGIEPESLTFPALAGEFFTTSVTWQALSIFQMIQIL